MSVRDYFLVLYVRHGLKSKQKSFVFHTVKKREPMALCKKEK